MYNSGQVNFSPKNPTHHIPYADQNNQNRRKSVSRVEHNQSNKNRRKSVSHADHDQSHFGHTNPKSNVNDLGHQIRRKSIGYLSEHSHHHSDGSHGHGHDPDRFFVVPRGVILSYGPYAYHGVYDFRIERLQGIQKVLQKVGARVKAIPCSDNLNMVEIWYMDNVIFVCKITDLQHGGDGELDPLCTEAARAFDHVSRKAIHGLRHRITAPNQEILDPFCPCINPNFFSAPPVVSPVKAISPIQKSLSLVPKPPSPLSLAHKSLSPPLHGEKPASPQDEHLKDAEKIKNILSIFAPHTKMDIAHDHNSV